MNQKNIDVEDQFSFLAGKVCWHVCARGFSDSTFSLHIGEKLARKSRLSEGHPASFRDSVGEFYVYVWSCWSSQLQNGDSVDSESEPLKIGHCIESLIGRSIVSATLELQLRTASIRFDNGLQLRIDGNDSGEEDEIGDWMEFASADKNYAICYSGAVLIETREDWTG